MTAIFNHHASAPTYFEDDIVALALQIEEINIFAQQGKGKHRVDQPPDIEVACRSFRTDLESYQDHLGDRKLAQSIGIAVHNDSAIIAALTSADVQACKDRQMALQLEERQDGHKNTSRCDNTKPEDFVDERVSTVAEIVAANSLAEFSDDEDEAGPSMTFAQRQADMLEKLSTKFTCCVCLERCRLIAMVDLPCGHRYCVDCAKDLFMRASRDETLFPPRCCKTPISPTLVKRHMSTEEFQIFELASVEFSTIDRVYCSNRECGKFVPPALVDGGAREVTCGYCDTRTCCLCKNGYHGTDECHDDPAIQETRQLALDMGWQSCPSCKIVVQLRSGCNHMTCRCKAEFCYVCGVQWKNCRCDVADEGRMLERAEEVVDREAEPDLPLAERNRRVRRVQAELRENHECEHPGRFQRNFGGGRRGFQCEMCDARHRKYILQCRHCYLNVCEDCRRNRI